MEIQKHLFRISQKALKSPNAICWWKFIFYSMSMLGTFFILVFIFGHALVLESNNDLTSCIKSQQFQFKNDRFYFITDRQLSQQQKAAVVVQNNTVEIKSECMIIKNKNYNELDDNSVMLGWDDVGMFMDREKRNKLKFVNYTILLQQVRPLRKLLFSFDNLLINQILNSPEPIFQNQRIVIKSKYALIFHKADTISTLTKFMYLFKVFFGYVGISIVTSLYIYGTIVAAPAVILFLLKTCHFMRMDGINDVFKLFPWIGVHAVIRDTSSTPIIKESMTQICKAILLYFFFLYLVYYAIIIWIDKYLYKTHMQLGLQQMLFGFVALTQFAAIVFMRTRSFIKYYPAIHSLLIVSLLYYGQVTDFGFKKIACYCAFTISWALFSWMVLKLQIPAQNVWDQNNPNTPREDRPRAGYFPLFNMSWIKNLPDEWTLMMPLFSRQQFSTRELVYVDRNNEQLANILGNRP